MPVHPVATNLRHSLELDRRAPRVGFNSRVCVPAGSFRVVCGDVRTLNPLVSHVKSFLKENYLVAYVAKLLAFSLKQGDTISMKTQPTSRPEGIRLYSETWPKLRAIMKIQGREWLERAIQREYNKLFKGEK